MNKPIDSKLLKLKKWLTLPEAARHLSGICGEKVTEADILRLALDDHLKLSVYFVNKARAVPGVMEELDQEVINRIVEGMQSEGNVDEETIQSIINIGSLKAPKFDSKKVIVIEEIFDLPMIAAERLDVEHKWQQLTGGPEVTLQCLEGAIVEDQNGGFYQLQESFDENEYQAGSKAQLKEIQRIIARNKISKEKAEELLNRHKEDRKKYLEERDKRPHCEDYYPAAGLPQDSIFVVRTNALREFEQLLSDNETEKSYQPRPHGNVEVYAQKREQVLGAALSVLSQWPEQCKNGSGIIKATKIAQLIDEKSLLYWPESGEPPLKRGVMEREISKWVNKDVK